MKKLTFATIATSGLAALSLGLAAPAVADGWDSTPVATGNDTSLHTGYRSGGPQGSPLPPRLAGGLGTGTVTIAGGPADELPLTSPGANPYLPLGVGN